MCLGHNQIFDLLGGQARKENKKKLWKTWKNCARAPAQHEQ
jgi:hypothetical protein